MDHAGNIASDNFSVAACLFVAADECLLRRCLAMAAFICSTLPIFSHHVTIQRLYILPTECICAFHIVLTANNDYFSKQY
jgi:hypothetical protein